MASDEKRPDTLGHARMARADSQAASWGPLTQKVHDHLERFRTAIFPPAMDFDDFVAEVMARILRDLRSIEIHSRGEFWSWLTRVADHVLTDVWRAQRAKKRTAPEGGTAGGDEVAGIRDGQPTPSAIARAREIESAELECIVKLPNDLGREVYVLRREHSLSFAEIAERTGQASAASARFVFFQMKQLVRDCLRRKLESGYSAFFRRLEEDGSGRG